MRRTMTVPVFLGTTMTRIPFLGVLAVALAAACGPDGAEVSRWTASVDTLPNGAARVINIPPSSGPEPTLAASEELRIGTRSIGGPASFGMIRQIAPLPDGGVAVLDGMAEEVRVFGADGEHEATFGGPGAGPGELRGAQGLLRGPDGLLRVPEKGNARMSYFHPDSGFVDSHRFYVYTTAGSGPWRAAMDSVGRTAVWSSGAYRGGFWTMVRIYDEEMVQIDSIPYHDYTNDRAGREDPEGGWPITAPNGMRGVIPVPFYPREEFVIDPTGQMWTTESGISRLEVRRWEPAGDTVLVVASRRQPDPVTDAMRDSVIAALEARFSAWPTPPRLGYSRIPHAEPPTYGLSLDNLGRLWVRLSSPESDTTAYDVFDRSGRHVETVVIHARVDEDVPPTLAGDTLWAVVRDEVDVQYIVRARLQKRDAARHGR